MPRPRSPSRDALVENAMRQFWKYGYEATSVDDLVQSTGVGRGALYTEFGGKRDLFLACLEHYQDAAVTPGFEQVEADGAGLEAIQEFLDVRMATFRSMDLPGAGCLVGNTLTELAALDPEISRAVRSHYDRLTDGFANALSNEMGLKKHHKQVRELAAFIAYSAQGLWAFSRCAQSVREVQERADTLMEVIKLKVEAWGRAKRSV